MSLKYYVIYSFLPFFIHSRKYLRLQMSAGRPITGYLNLQFCLSDIFNLFGKNYVKIRRLHPIYSFLSLFKDSLQACRD